MRVSITPEQVGTVFATLSQSPAFAESAAVVAAGGEPVEMLRAMSLRPEILRGFGALSEGVYPGGLVEREIKELIILDVSHRNRCQFCEASHVDISRAIGMGPDPLAMLEDLEQLPERQRLGVEYARAAVADSTRIPESFFDRLREAFNDEEIVELTAVIGLISMLNLFNNCLEIRYRDDYTR